MAQPVRFAAIPRPDGAIAPRLGQDAAEVLSSLLGMTPADIDDLRHRGILGAADPEPGQTAPEGKAHA
jgi:crotonobetainyl-CoA:carnitine CoA-transferase CaiB-like acyl-CoA transferase